MSHWDKCKKCGKYFDKGVARSYGNNMPCACAHIESLRHKELIEEIKKLKDRK